MASSGKRKTTRAKLDRERRLVERRLDKKAKKEARKQLAAGHSVPVSDDTPFSDSTSVSDDTPATTDQTPQPTGESD